MTALLASVVSLEEAETMVAAGADLIDLKDPAAGALGALPLATAAGIVAALRGRRPVSATVGDLPLTVEAILPAVIARAATGVDYVKIGFFAGGDPLGVIRALIPETRRGLRLVAVLPADERPDLELLPELAAAGFAGVMLDTADKARGSLLDLCAPSLLRDFVGRARHHHLLCGLAGSLRSTDVPLLLPLKPDYLGFRGALCGGNRVGRIDPVAAGSLRAMLPPSRANPLSTRRPSATINPSSACGPG